MMPFQHGTMALAMAVTVLAATTVTHASPLSTVLPSHHHRRHRRQGGGGAPTCASLTTPIAINDASFETDTPPGTSTFFNFDTQLSTHWTPVGRLSQCGIITKTATPTMYTAGMLASVDGNQVLFTHESCGVAQTTTHTVQANTKYRLSFDVLKRNDGLDFGGYRALLCAGPCEDGVVLAQAQDPGTVFTPSDTSAITITVEGSTGVDTTPPSGLLTVELRGFEAQSHFDNVVLVAISPAVTPVAVEDASFETVYATPTPQGHTFYAFPAGSGAWVPTGRPGDSGIILPRGESYNADGLAAVHGTQVMFTHSIAGAQQTTTALAAPNTRYVLTFWVLKRLDTAFGGWRGKICLGPCHTGMVLAQDQAGSVFEPTDGYTQGQFVTIEGVTGDTVDTNAFIHVELSGFRAQTHFDKVQLSSEACVATGGPTPLPPGTEVVAVGNPSFEANYVTDAQLPFFTLASQSIASWTAVGSASSCGIVYLPASAFPNDAEFAAVDGSLTLFANDDCGVMQTVGPWVAHSRYELSFWTYKRGESGATFGGYVAKLCSDGTCASPTNVLVTSQSAGSHVFVPTSPFQQAQKVVVEYTTGATPPTGEVTIEIRGKVRQTNFDRVALLRHDVSV